MEDKDQSCKKKYLEVNFGHKWIPNVIIIGQIQTNVCIKTKIISTPKKKKTNIIMNKILFMFFLG